MQQFARILSIFTFVPVRIDGDQMMLHVMLYYVLRHMIMMSSTYALPQGFVPNNHCQLLMIPFEMRFCVRRKFKQTNFN